MMMAYDESTVSISAVVVYKQAQPQATRKDLDGVASRIGRRLLEWAGGVRRQQQQKLLAAVHAPGGRE